MSGRRKRPVPEVRLKQITGYYVIIARERA
jgi:hypothetical protein